MQVLTPVHLHCRCDVAVVRLISSDVLAAFHGASRRVLVLDLEHVLVSNSVPFACGKALDSTTDDVRSPSASRHRRRRSSTASSATLPPVLPPCVEALCALPNTVVVILSGHSRTVVSSICAGVNAVLVAEHGCYLRYEPLCRLLCERVHPLCDDVAPCVVACRVVVCRGVSWCVDGHRGMHGKAWAKQKRSELGRIAHSWRRCVSTSHPARPAVSSRSRTAASLSIFASVTDHCSTWCCFAWFLSGKRGSS